MVNRHFTRRRVLAGCMSAGLVLSAGRQALSETGFKIRESLQKRPVSVVSVPSNLGLRPLREGHQPGTWRAPAALREAGLLESVNAVTHMAAHIDTPRPPYSFDKQEGTRIRNGRTIREHALMLADVIGRELLAGRFPIVVGGDCSILLGCLVAARRVSPLSLIHIDGHSDFFHPGNYDTSSRLGSAAGMDLALVTGRGEELLTTWPGIGCPLVEDRHVIQLGERNQSDPVLGFPEVDESEIRRVPVQQILSDGVDTTVSAALNSIKASRRQFWLHVDLDVLDKEVMPAVDSPGSPGLDFQQLSELVGGLLASEYAMGMNVSIYDPELDPGARIAGEIVNSISRALTQLHQMSGDPASQGTTT